MPAKFEPGIISSSRETDRHRAGKFSVAQILVEFFCEMVKGARILGTEKRISNGEEAMG